MSDTCPHTTCGGCSKTAIPYEKQLADKHQALKRLL